MQFISVLLSKVHIERQNIHFFELKWLNCMHKKLGTFSLFALCSSDNLVHILFQLGTFRVIQVTTTNKTFC